MRSATAIAALAVASVLASCGQTPASTPGDHLLPSAHGGTPLRASATPAGTTPHAWDVVHALERANLAVPNALDTTSQECPVAGCDQAVVTDTLRVKSFATAQLSTRYASARGLDHAGTIVVSFAPPIAATERAQYWEQIQKLVSEAT